MGAIVLEENFKYFDVSAQTVSTAQAQVFPTPISLTEIGSLGDEDE
jgi:hypothetical protein